MPNKSTTTLSPKKIIRTFLFLLRTGAPLHLHYAYLKERLISGYKNKFEATDFESAKKNGRFSNDWFSGNIGQWQWYFKVLNFNGKKIKALEIGSWEGLSSLFLLTTLKQLELTCVDTWNGADEHQGSETLGSIESNFKFNLQPFKDRLITYKGTSLSFFSQCKNSEGFDLIYVDGSHFTDDVFLDGLLSFQHLKVGGILIFDDYLWIYYDDLKNNPAGAINHLLKMKAGRYKILSVGYQLAIIKTKNDIR